MMGAVRYVRGGGEEEGVKMDVGRRVHKTKCVRWEM